MRINAQKHMKPTNYINNNNLKYQHIIFTLKYNDEKYK